MTSAYTNKYVSDIPLKRPQETFVDDPGSLEEVSLDDLVFRLAHDIKDINSLHAFQAVAVFNAVLRDLIFLGSRADAREQFRRQQLKAHSLDLDELEAEAARSAATPDSAQPSPVLPEAPDATLGSEAPEPPAVATLSGFPLDENNELPRSPLMSQEDTSMQSLDALEPAGDGQQSGFISTESLVQTTSLEMVEDPITCHNIERFRREVLFHMAPKVQQQAEHLLRCFALAKAPPISVEQFLVRIKTYLPSISVSVYIHSAYMLYKLCVLLDVVVLSPLNVYRFVLALLRCLTKKLEDVHQRQQSFATVGGVALKELSRIEVSFLYLSNFKMIVSERILSQFLTADFVALHNYCENLRTENTADEE